MAESLRVFIKIKNCSHLAHFMRVKFSNGHAWPRAKVQAANFGEFWRRGRNGSDGLPHVRSMEDNFGHFRHNTIFYYKYCLI